MVEMSIEGVRRDFWRYDLYIVSLWNEAERRLLNLSIGQPEAYTLSMELHHIPAPRPTTLHLMVNTFRALAIKLERVHIERLQLAPIPIFYAIINVHNGEIMQELDARPSDALGLALMMNVPIYVSEELLTTVGVTLPEDKTPEQHYAEELLKRENITLPAGKKLRLGYSKVPARDALLREIKATLLGIPLPLTELDATRARKNYLTFLLGEDFQEGE